MFMEMPFGQDSSILRRKYMEFMLAALLATTKLERRRSFKSTAERFSRPGTIVGLKESSTYSFQGAAYSLDV